MNLQRVAVLVGMMVLGGCDSNDPFRPRLLADLTSDVTPPTLTALGFSPNAINTTLGAATVTLSYTLTDDLSGVMSLCAQFLSPSGAQSRANCDFFTATTNRSGSFDIAFPQFGEAGTWKLSVYSIQDAAGNFRSYSQVDLAAAGFSTDLMVGLLSVSIDIQPGSTLTSIKLSKQGKVTVAILSDASFNAPSRVVRSSLTFGHTGDEPSLASCAKEGEDVNGDGFKDLICQFYVQRTGFQVGDTQGILRGRMIDQVPIEGKDAVRVLK